MTDLLTLSARVEAATGPDRGIDAEIELATGNWNEHHYDAWCRFQECGEAANPPISQPCDPQWFTTSLDAAMTLVPEGWRSWTADMSVNGRIAWMLVGPKTKWVEGLDGLMEAGDDWYQSGVSSTPALALTAACLRALAAQHEGEGS